MPDVTHLHFFHPAEKVSCYGCKRWVADVYAESLVDAQAGRGLCAECAATKEFEREVLPNPSADRPKKPSQLAREHRAAVREARRAAKASANAGNEPSPVLEQLNVAIDAFSSDLDGMSMRALRKEATDLNIEGRSKMDEAALREAIAAAQVGA